MNQFTIFANGDTPIEDIFLPPDETVIAADGGARHCLKLGITPQVIIGDFDSLSEEEITILKAKGAKLIKHPTDKDKTDLELALDYAVKMGATKIILYGLLGGRWDMSFTNILLLASSKFAGINFQIISQNTKAYILRSGQLLEIRGLPGTIISTIPLNGPAQGITYQGLQWPLEKATLPYGSARGVSNVMTTNQARISLEEGILLVFVSGEVSSSGMLSRFMH